MSDFVIEKNVLKSYTGKGPVVVVPDGVVKVNRASFRNAIGPIEKIVLPDSVEVISNGAFWGRTDLKEVRLPEKLETLPIVFADGTRLATLHLPASIKETETFNIRCAENVTVGAGSPYTVQDKYVFIGNQLFAYFGEDQSEIVVPSNAKSIGNFAFANHREITRVVISKSVTKVGESAFDTCTELQEVEYLGNVSTIEDKTFFFCKNLNKVIFPPKLKKIGKEAFWSCDNLSIDALPETVETIKADAFYGYKGTPFFDKKSTLWENICNGKKVDIVVGQGSAPVNKKKHEDFVKDFIEEKRKELGIEVFSKDHPLFNDNDVCDKNMPCTLPLSNNTIKMPIIKQDKNFSFKIPEAEIFTAGQYISAETANKIGKARGLKKLTDDVFAVYLWAYNYNAEKRADKLMKGDKLTFKGLNATIYQEYTSLQHLVFLPNDSEAQLNYLNGRVEIVLNENKQSNHLSLNLTQLDNGDTLYLPVRLRIPFSLIGKNEELKLVNNGGEASGKYSGGWFTLQINDINYQFYFDDYAHLFDPRLCCRYGIDDKIKFFSDENSHYADFLLEFEYTYPYWM